MLATLLMTTSLMAGTPPDAERLRAQVAAEQQARPQGFARVERMRSYVAGHPLNVHGRVAAARQLMALGPEGVLPMLDLLALRPEKLAELPDSSRVGLTAAMLDALREQKDVRAAPVLRGVLDGPETEPLVVDAAAAALGALCRDEDVNYLAARARPGDPRELSAIHGLGWCRKGTAAQALVESLEQGSGDQAVERAADALGWLGSSWAWQALGSARQAEGAALRGSISGALVQAWMEHPAARKKVEHALVMVHHPEAVARLTQATAGADDQTARDAARVLASLGRR